MDTPTSEIVSDQLEILELQHIQSWKMGYYKIQRIKISKFSIG